MSPVSTTRSPRGARAGFTLVEAVCAAGAAGVLLAALGSVLSIASRAMPNEHDAVTDSAAVRRAMLNMSAEISEATKIITAKPDTIEFQVADRDADGLPETVKYSWSGVKGEPVLRTYGGAAATVVDGVSSLVLTYTSKAGSIVGDPVATVSPEKLLGWYRADTDSTTILTSTTGEGEMFYPNLPETATSWTVTKVKLWVAPRGATDGVGTVEIITSTGRTVASAAVLETAFPVSADFVSYTFASPGSLTPSEGAAVLTKLTSGTNLGQWSYQSTGVGSSSMWFAGYSGGTWTLTPMKSYKFEAYGTYTYPVTSTTAVQRLSAVQIAVKCASVPGATITVTAASPAGAVMP